MRIKEEVLSNGSFIIKDGTDTRFWEDTWVGDKPLKVRYPNLYNIVRDPHATVSKVMGSSTPNLSFRRSLVDNKLVEWLSLVARISHVQLVDGPDYFKWSLTRSGNFSVRSMYLHLIDAQPPFNHKGIWKIRVPLKIKIFLWFLKRRVVLTKDNLARKNWKGSQKCISCNRNETIQHLFLDCPFSRMIWRIIFYATNLTQPSNINHMFGTWLSNQNKKIKGLIWVGVAALCWAIWRCRNDVIFNKSKTNSSMQVIFRGAYWLRSWAQLQREEQAKDSLSLMSKKLEMIALEISHRGWKHLYRLL